MWNNSNGHGWFQQKENVAWFENLFIVFCNLILLLGQKLCGIYSCKWYKVEIMDWVLTVVSCFNATSCILQNNNSLIVIFSMFLISFLIYWYKNHFNKFWKHCRNSQFNGKVVSYYHTVQHFFPNHYFDLRWHLKRDSNGSSFNINYAYNT